MSRLEFSKPVRVEIIRRATRDNQTYCEGCGALAKTFEIDHTTPEGLQTGRRRKLTAKDGKLLGPCCHKPKTKADKGHIAKAKRQEADHLRANPAPRRPIQSPGFQPTEKAVERAKSKTKEPLFANLGPPGIARRFAVETPPTRKGK